MKSQTEGRAYKFMRATFRFIIALLVLLGSGLGLAQEYEITFGPMIEAYVGQNNLMIPITITNLQPVEYIHISLSYDPSLLQAVAVAPAIFFQGVHFDLNTAGKMTIELDRDLVPPPFVPPIPVGETTVAYITMNVAVNNLGRDIGTPLLFLEDPNTPYPDNLFLLDNGYFIVPPMLTLTNGMIYIFEPLYGDVNINNDPFEVGDAVSLVNYFIGCINLSPRQKANSDCNRDNIQATIADLVYMLRIINGEPDTLRRILSPLLQPDITQTPTPKTTNSLDNFAKLTIYLYCSEPLGGFCFSLKVPEAVDRVRDGVMGVNAGNLLLASGKRSDTLTFVGYSLTEDNLPQGYFMLMELPFEAHSNVSADDFEILSADFSNASGSKINAAIKLIAGKWGENEADADTQSNIAPGEIIAYPNPFNSTVSIRFASPKPQQIAIEIYDMLGRKVSMLSDGFFTEGEHTVIWNGTNQNGAPVAAGVYLCRLKSQTEDTTLKLNYMK
jgi:hypothetical protein